jgi:hypothetical protein
MSRGTYLVVFQRKDAPKAEYTVVAFTVDNVEATVKWFKDPDGNTLAVTSAQF